VIEEGGKRKTDEIGDGEVREEKWKKQVDSSTNLMRVSGQVRQGKVR
jgi:hypothetical protein